MGQTGELLSHNVYAYCANNPVSMSDSSGRRPVETGAEIAFYKTADAAAEAWSRKNMADSVRDNLEYGGAIYQTSMVIGEDTVTVFAIFKWCTRIRTSLRSKACDSTGRCRNGCLYPYSREEYTRLE